MGNKLSTFFKESYSELKKVTWLSRQEVIASTIVIIILISILSVFVALIDLMFVRLVGFIL